jgi:outer membrane protein assembly factor BamD
MNMRSRSGVNRPMTKRYALYAIALFVSMSCTRGFYAASFTTMDSLYAGAMKEYNAGNWDNATKAFERLTHDLDPRDPRLPVSYYYLGKSQARMGDHLLAATSFTRVSESFPQDTLADDALYESGVAYERMWRRPDLDPQYGDNAINAYRLLIALYPQSPLVPRATKEISKLDQWLATKDYETGYHYLKRKAYDSAIIYFKDVLRLHPDAPKAREAGLRLLEAYRAIRYTDDAKDLCTTLRTKYPNDREVREACGSAQVKS